MTRGSSSAGAGAGTGKGSGSTSLEDTLKRAMQEQTEVMQKAIRDEVKRLQDLFTAQLEQEFEARLTPWKARVAELEKRLEQQAVAVAEQPSTVSALAESFEELRANVHHTNWPARRRGLIVRNVKAGTTTEATMDRLLAYLSLEQPIEYDNAFHVHMPGRDATAVCFTVKSESMVQQFFSPRVRSLLEREGLSVAQQTTAIERRRRARMWDLPAFRAALEAEVRKPRETRFVQWQLDCCLIGKGECQRLWFLERAQKAQAAADSHAGPTGAGESGGDAAAGSAGPNGGGRATTSGGIVPAY